MYRTAFLRICTLTLSLLLTISLAYGAATKGQPAPEFKLTTTSGKQLSLSALKGQVVILDFFTTWCPPCRESIPHLVGLSKKYGKQGLQIVGMSMDEDGEQVVRDFVAEKGIPYPVAVINQQTASSYSIRSIPTLYIIDKQGRIANRVMGFNPVIAQQMEQEIKRLLAE